MVKRGGLGLLLLVLLTMGAGCSTTHNVFYEPVNTPPEDLRHELCVKGQLPLLTGVGKKLDKKYFNPLTEELYMTERPFYVETMKGGRKVEGCIPSGIPIVAKKGNRYAEHFATTGWRDIMNLVPVLPTPASVPERQGKKNQDQAPKCLAAGTWATGIGSGALTAGIATRNSWLIAGGAIVSITGIFDKEVYGTESDGRCKAAAALVGGSIGYASGSAYRQSSRASSYRSGAGGGPGSPPPVPGGGGTGPVVPPPVP